MERQGLVCDDFWAHNSVVTITYPNRIRLEAIVLSHDDHEIRAISNGCDDVLVFTRIHGTWISEELEPVIVEFEWQRRSAAPDLSRDACICPKELAARLMWTLVRSADWVH